MRNLKRAFSLVLALVMVLSVMTIAPVAAADETAPATVTSNFADAAEINPDYMQAVAITGGINLFAGADGKFMPKGTVTRAQMATIIVKMLYGDANADSFKGSGKFIDTAYFEGGWAEGYINWCATLGVVAGYGDGTFKPGNQVTTAEAATMILNALKIDAGEGTWPNTVMAKAEEEDLFGDLKPMPGTNTALTREELAVIALNGLNWTATDETGWYVTGGAADEKMTFETYKDAQKYADKVSGEVQPLEGRDSLANKVYELKKASGWITGNQATGLEYTEVTLAWDNPRTEENESAKASFAIATDAAMIGHKVEVWYKETWTSEKNPGLTYAVAEAAEYITLAEDAETAKEYKAAFDTRYDMPASVVVTDAAGYVAEAAGIEGYEAGEAALAGTYVIDLETGDLCGYITPAAVTADVVDYIDVVTDEEAIHLKGLGMLSNTEEDDDVVEYEGIAKDDLVTYIQVQGKYVLTKLTNVAGTMEKYTIKDGEYYVTVDGKEYRGFTGESYIDPTRLTKLDNLDTSDIGEMFVFYLAPDNTVVGYTVAEGGALNLAEVVYFVGGMEKVERDSYGKTSTILFGRGVDMTGNEAMVPLAVRKNTSGTGLGGDAPIFEPADPDCTYGEFIKSLKGFFTIKDADTKEAKELGIKRAVPFGSAYDENNPEKAFQSIYPMGGTGADWVTGGRFEYGVQDRFTGSGAFGGYYSYPHKNTKFIMLEGDVDQNEPLVTSVTTGSVSANIGERIGIYTLLTHQSTGLNSVEVAVIPTSIDHATNATMIYVPRTWDASTYSWSDYAQPAGRTAEGYEYEVYDGTTGAAMTIVVGDDVDRLESGFHSISLDAQTQLYNLSGVKVPNAANRSELESASSYATNDGRKYESVAYDLTVNAYNQSTMWFSYANGSDKISCSGMKVVDTRTDDQVSSNGVPRITSMDQLWSMVDTYSRKATFTLDVSSTSKILVGFVKVNVLEGTVEGNTIENGDTLPSGVDVVYDPTGNGVTAGNFAQKAEEALITYKITNNGVDGKVLEVTGVYAQGATENNAENILPTGVVKVIDQRDVAEAEKITADNLADKAASKAISYVIYSDGVANVLKITAVADANRTTDADELADVDPDTPVTNKTGNTDYDNKKTVADLIALAAGGDEVDFTIYVLGDKTVVALNEVVNGGYTDITNLNEITSGGSYRLSGNATGMVNLAAGEYVLNLNGYTLTNTSAPFITVETNARLTIKGEGTIQGIADGADDAMIKIKAGGILNLEGGTLTGHHNTGTNGSAISVVDGAAGAQVNISGGKIIGNTSTTRGGGISMGDGGDSTLTITGGTITGNISTAGGYEDDIYSHTGTINVSGGTVDKIYWRGGYMNISGGTIAAARTGNTGGTTPGTTVAITGNPKVESLALYTANGTVVPTIGDLTPGASITTSTVLDVLDDTVVKESGKYVYGTGEAPEETANAVTAVSFEADPTLTLTANSTIDSTITLRNGTYSLDLAGYELTGTAAPFFNLVGAELTITDSTRKDADVTIYGSITGNSATAPLFKATNGGKLIVAGGTLQGHAGDIVEVGTTGLFTMTGGVINGEVTDNSGAVTGANVTYIANDDNNDAKATDISTEPQYMFNGVKMPLPAAPSREGYDFAGWLDSTGATTAPDATEYTGTGNGELTAQWVEHTFTVSYDLQGGTGTGFEDQTKLYHTDLILTDAEPTKDHYTFLGWSEIPGGDSAEDVDYAAGAAYTVNESKTLYAVWKPHEYTVKLYWNHPNVVDDDRFTEVTKVYDTDLPLALTASGAVLVGTMLEGWYKDSACTEKVLDADEPYTDEIGLEDGITELYANWTEQVITITYNVNGGEGTIANNTRTYYSDPAYIILSGTNPTRDGYDFIGWAESATATAATYQFGAQYAGTENKTLYAVWQLKTYTVTYDGGATGSDTKTHGQTLVLDRPADTAEKYFEGWATDDGGDVVYGLSNLEYTADEDDTLYAVWGTYGTTALPTSGNIEADGAYRLTANHVLTNTLTIKNNAEVVIDLAGHTISMPSKDAVYFNIIAGGKLTIRDSVGGGKIQMKNTVAGYGGIQVSSNATGGTFELVSGELTGWTRINNGTYEAGGMINVWDGATFTMTGGKITGADCGSNTVIRTHAANGITGGNITFTMTGGEITGNHAQSGNLIEVKGTAAKNATLTIKGTAKIDGNTWGANNVDFAPTGTGHEIAGLNTHITIGGSAVVGGLYNDAENNTTDNSSYTFTGAPTVASVRWSNDAETPVSVTELTEGASITMSSTASTVDATVARTTTDDNRYLYTYADNQ